MSRKPRQLLRARAAVAHLPRRPGAGELRLLPSVRSIAIGLGLAVLAALTYVGARETSVFAIRTIEVQGAPPLLERQVRIALRPLEGQSLMKLRADELSRLATALPEVESVSYDRAFPTTLRVRVQPERPLAVLRQGPSSWLVSRRGRVIAPLARGALPGFPRIWVPRSVNATLGGTLGAGGGAEEVAALAPVGAAGLGARIATVRVDKGQIVYVLKGGAELRVGTMTNLPLKLAIARQILSRTAVAGYLDVSVPERPVAATNLRVSG